MLFCAVVFACGLRLHAYYICYNALSMFILYSIVFSSVQVANVVLNSHFVYLLLKITKTPIVYTTTSRMSSTTNTAANALVTTMNANAYTSRVLCITTLAMMLRYATILNPPTIRLRDEHIVVTIVSLLNASSATNNSTRGDRSSTANSAVDKIDVKFRRRLVAALGEVVFYISAQEDPDNRCVLLLLVCIMGVEFLDVLYNDILTIVCVRIG